MFKNKLFHVYSLVLKKNIYYIIIVILYYYYKSFLDYFVIRAIEVLVPSLRQHLHLLFLSDSDCILSNKANVTGI